MASPDSAERGPVGLNRVDHYWRRVLAANVGTLVLTAAWVLVSRSFSIVQSVPSTFGFFVLLQVLLSPAAPGDRDDRNSLRLLVAVVASAISWVVLALLGFGRL